MKKTLSIFAFAAVAATNAFAIEITPYASVGIVADKAGTSAKRIGIDEKNMTLIPNGGGDMKFDAAIAGDFALGLKIGSVRTEFEYAVRSASEDEYDLYSGIIIPSEVPGMQLLADVETTTSVKHNSFMFNLYYDFDITDSKWTPYVGAGVGLGTYKQNASVKIDFENDMMPDKTLASIDNNKKEFEWQVALGTAYNFTEDWALDVAYRFNSSTVDSEFVYAHELKLAVRYSF